MIAYGSQNQLQSSLAPLSDLLKAIMFFSNLNGFNSSRSLSDQGFAKRKGSSKVWKEKGHQVILSLSSLSLCLCFCTTCVFCFYFESVQFYAFLCLTFFCLLFSVLFIFVFHIKKLKNQKNTKTVCVLCTLVLVYLEWPLKQNFLNFVSFVAQMSISMHN